MRRTCSSRSLARGVLTCLAIAIALAMLATSCATRAGASANSAASSCSTAASIGADAEAVRRLEERGARVNVEGWGIDEAREFFTPTWVSVGPDGVVRGVDDVYATFVDGRSRPWASSFELLDLDIRVYCDMAIVIGLAEARGSTPEQVMRVRYLNVWRKIDGSWRYSEQQYVRL